MPQTLPVRILLATRNGAAYLPAQLDSFVAQTWPDWSLLVGDDGSQDATRAVLAGFGARHPGRLVAVQDGPGTGAAANFLTLLAQTVATAPAAAVAFSDQDDVWLPAKLDRAARWLLAHGAAEGQLLAWVCRTVLTDAHLQPIGESRHYGRPPGFGNALVQNILAGNTIVLSPAAAAALAATVPAALAAGVPHHDWWMYQVLTGIGAQIGMEEAPLVLYRQHGGNLLGHHGPVRGRLQRLGSVARRDYARWISANLTALAACAAQLTPDAQAQLAGLVAARAAGPRTLAAALPRLGIHRQTANGDRILRMIAMAGRL
jgi:hypothetical protein